MDGIVYILQSLKNNSYYVGSTTILQQRLKQHNSGQVKATKYKRPFELVFNQKFPNLKIAMSIERRIKKFKRRDYIERIINDGHIKMDP